MDRFDLVICGGSFIGLALARALVAEASGAYRIAIIEKRGLEEARAGAFDKRSAAITAAGSAMLTEIGVWGRLSTRAQAILSIELTDSSLDAPIRQPLMVLEAALSGVHDPTAYIVENTALREALFASLDGAGEITWFPADSVIAFETGDAGVRVDLASGTSIHARLLAAADGQNSALRKMAGIGATVWNAGKLGISLTAGIELPHCGIARQHFLPAGPFAILPMTGNRVSIVWTEYTATATDILGRGRQAILDAIARRMGPRYGELTILSEPTAYPLTMTLARTLVLPGFALIGDAAHGLHWIAGQGLNHGLKDVAALTETLVDASRLGLDIGSLAVLKRYERWRRFDSATSAFSAAAINAIFSNDNMAFRMLRSTGMRSLDRMTGVKAMLQQEAAGLTGTLPKLLRGLPV